MVHVSSRLPRAPASLAVTMLLLAACGGGGGSRATSNPTFSFPLGDATELSTGCARGPGVIGSSQCRAVRIRGGTLPSIVADVRIATPPLSTPVVGTVLLGSGGGGVDFYEDVAGGEQVVQRLRNDGYVVVQRAWRSDWAMAGNAGAREGSRRYAILLQWVRSQFHTTGPFCVTGNSGGSAEIGYALTTWGLGDQIDVAVLSSGPPLARLDYVCISPSPAPWATQCPSIVPASTMQCGLPACNEPTNSVCTLLGANPTATQLHEDSVLHSAAQLSFPTTRVHVLLGTQDCTVAVPQGLLFVDAVSSPIVTEFVPNAPHWIAQVPDGQDAVVRAIESTTLAANANDAVIGAAWPRLGQSLAVWVHGVERAPFEVLLAARAAALALPGLGRLGLAPPMVTIGEGHLNGNGTAVVALPMPDDPALVGCSLYPQALIGGQLSNALRVVVRR